MLVAIAVLLKVRVLPSTVSVSSLANPMVKALLLGEAAAVCAVEVVMDGVVVGTVTGAEAKALRPSLVSVPAVEPVKSMAVVVLVVSSISPCALTDEEPPVIWLIASRTLPIVELLPEPTPIVKPADTEPLRPDAAAVENVIVLPLTVRESPPLRAEVSADGPPPTAVPTRRVAEVISGDAAAAPLARA